MYYNFVNILFYKFINWYTSFRAFFRGYYFACFPCITYQYSSNSFYILYKKYKDRGNIFNYLWNIIIRYSYLFWNTRIYFICYRWYNGIKRKTSSKKIKMISNILKRDVFQSWLYKF